MASHVIAAGHGYLCTSPFDDAVTSLKDWAALQSWLENANHWRAITRLGAGVQVAHSRLSQHQHIPVLSGGNNAKYFDGVRAGRDGWRLRWGVYRTAGTRHGSNYSKGSATVIFNAIAICCKPA